MIVEGALPYSGTPFGIVLLTVAAFAVSFVTYGLIERARMRSAGFSPTVASVLTTPLLMLAYYIWATTEFASGRLAYEFLRVLVELALFAPIVLVLAPLLAIYLRGGFRSKSMSGVILCAVTVACVILEIFWLYLAIGRGS